MYQAVRAMNKSRKATEALTEQSGKSWYAIGVQCTLSSHISLMPKTGLSGV